MIPVDPPATRLERIVVVLDASQRSLAVLDAASWLAGTLVQRLEALFIEEESLTRIAGFPFAREISPIGAVLRTLDRDAMARDLRAAAERARRAVEAAAGRSSVPWDFAVVRGRYEHAVVEYAAAGGVVAFGIERGAARFDVEEIARGGGPYLLVGPRASLRQGPVLVHAGETASASRAGNLAARIAAASGQTVVRIPDLADILAASGVPGAAGRAGPADRRQAHLRPSLVVVTRDIWPPSVRLIDVLEHALCPILVTASAVEADAEPERE